MKNRFLAPVAAAAVFLASCDPPQIEKYFLAMESSGVPNALQADIHKNIVAAVRCELAPLAGIQILDEPPAEGTYNIVQVGGTAECKIEDMKTGNCITEVGGRTEFDPSNAQHNQSISQVFSRDINGKTLPPKMIAQKVVHEIGHTLGLGHSDDPQFPGGEEGSEPTLMSSRVTEMTPWQFSMYHAHTLQDETAQGEMTPEKYSKVTRNLTRDAENGRCKKEIQALE